MSVDLLIQRLAELQKAINAPNMAWMEIDSASLFSGRVSQLRDSHSESSAAESDFQPSRRLW
jgi:hypothetical protein